MIVWYNVMCVMTPYCPLLQHTIRQWLVVDRPATPSTICSTFNNQILPTNAAVFASGDFKGLKNANKEILSSWDPFFDDRPFGISPPCWLNIDKHCYGSWSHLELQSNRHGHFNQRVTAYIWSIINDIWVIVVPDVGNHIWQPTNTENRCPTHLSQAGPVRAAFNKPSRPSSQANERRSHSSDTRHNYVINEWRMWACPRLISARLLSAATFLWQGIPQSCTNSSVWYGQ